MVPRFKTKSVTDLSEPDIILISTKREVHNHVLTKEPKGKIKMQDKKAISGDRCTMCYRCINNCPKQAITLLGNHITEQCVIEKHPEGRI